MPDDHSLPSTAWNRILAQAGHVFREPHPAVARLLDMSRLRAGALVLDLGCGTGRHAVLAAARGYTVIGLDDSHEALLLASEWLNAEWLSARLIEGSMFAALPAADGSLDAVIAVQSIHHARRAEIEGAIAEVTRALRPGGLLFLTVPTLRNQSDRFEEIEPNTFVPLDGPERGLPRHFL
jgi:SAM-dependent methyltransferase